MSPRQRHHTTNVDGLTYSYATLSPNVSFSDNESNSAILSPPKHRPPLSTVFVKETSEDGLIFAAHGALLVGTSKNTASITTAKTTASGFRLQPRNPVNGPPFDCRGTDGYRSRKRRANSISTTQSPRRGLTDRTLSLLERSHLPESLQVADAGTLSTKASRQQESSQVYYTFKTEEPCSPSLESTMGAIQGLSILSPRPDHLSGFIESPMSFAGSKQSGFQSFSRYGSSPARSLSRSAAASPRTPHARRPRSAGASPASSIKSSPRLAPLTVLSHNDKSPVKRRPRYNSGSSVLLRTLNEGVPGEGAKLSSDVPILSVQCQASPKADSSLTVVHDGIEDSPSKTPRRFTMDSPSRRHMPSPRTPMPKISLTPRSAKRAGSRAGIPFFPSPAGHVCPTPNGPTSGGVQPCGRPVIPVDLPDDDDMNTSLSPLWRPGPPQARAASFIPLPNWAADDSGHGETGEGLSLNSPSTDIKETPVKTKLFKCESLLEPDSAKETSRWFSQAARRERDSGTLSESDGDDDDGAFLLAAPADIEEEKASRQEQVKHRRLFKARVPSRENMLAGGAGKSFLGAHASDGSLCGIGLIPSNVDLCGMDSGSHHATSTTSLRRDESQVSIGLSLERSSSTMVFDANATTAMAPDRNLMCTPPVMLPASSPPPISARTNLRRLEQEE